MICDCNFFDIFWFELEDISEIFDNISIKVKMYCQNFSLNKSVDSILKRKKWYLK